MASKELIEKVAKSIYESWENVPHASNRDWSAYVEKLPGGAACFRKHAEAAIATILADLQEPSEGMYQSGIKYHDIEKTPSVYHGLFRAMLNASPLGEKAG